MLSIVIYLFILSGFGISTILPPIVLYIMSFLPVDEHEKPKKIVLIFPILAIFYDIFQISTIHGQRTGLGNLANGINTFTIVWSVVMFFVLLKVTEKQKIEDNPFNANHHLNNEPPSNSTNYTAQTPANVAPQISQFQTTTNSVANAGDTKDTRYFSFAVGLVIPIVGFFMYFAGRNGNPTEIRNANYARYGALTSLIFTLLALVFQLFAHNLGF